MTFLDYLFSLLIFSVFSSALQQTSKVNKGILLYFLNALYVTKRASHTKGRK